MKQYVITISRDFASMGRSIAQALARELGVDFYDRDIVEAAAARSLTAVNAYVPLSEVRAAAWQVYTGQTGLSEALLPLL